MRKDLHTKPRRWQHDSEVNECPHCQVTFTFITRKHHCRLCGFVVCNSCSKHQSPLPTLGYDKSVRVCDKCIFKYISSESSAFASKLRFPRSVTTPTGFKNSQYRIFGLNITNLSSKIEKQGVNSSCALLPSAIKTESIKNQLAFNGLENAVGNAFDQSDFLFGAQKSGEEKSIAGSFICPAIPKLWVPLDYALACFGCSKNFELSAYLRHQ